MVKQGSVKLFKQTDQNLYQDYSSTPAQFDAAIQQGMDEQRQTFSDIAQSRQALLRAVTPEEWNTIIAAAKRQDEEAAAKLPRRPPRRRKSRRPDRELLRLRAP